MARNSWIVPVLLTLPALGCGSIQELDVEKAGQETPAQVGEARQALERYCASDAECNVYAGCACISGVCQAGGGGPPPEGDTCSLPPQRACTTSADCHSGCDCIGGTCQDLWGPPYEGDYCARQPPDAYEGDNTAATASSYLGYPQTGHTFHEVGDVDWVVVYVANAAQVTFETYDTQGSNTILDLYTYNPSTGAPGSLIASNDDKCAVWYDTNCWGSKIVRSVPAQSAFFVRVRYKTGWAPNVYDSSAPGYSLRIF